MFASHCANMCVLMCFRLCTLARCFPSRRYLPRCVSSRLLNVCYLALFAGVRYRAVAVWIGPRGGSDLNFTAGRFRSAATTLVFELNRTAASFRITGFAAVRLQIMTPTQRRNHTSNTTPSLHGSVVTTFVLAAT